MHKSSSKNQISFPDRSFARGDSDGNISIDMSVRRWRTAHYTPFLCWNLQRMARNFMVQCPLLWNMISLHGSPMAHGSSSESGIGSCEKFVATVHQVDIWRRAWIIFYSLCAIIDVLVTRSTYWNSIDCLLPSQRPQKQRFPNPDVF